MLHLLAAVLIAAAPPPQGDEVQVLAGPNFDSLIKTVDARCPTSRVLYTKAAVLLDAEESFHAALPPARRAALDRVIHGDAEVQRCMTVNGASCSAGANIGAYRKAGLMPDFVTAVCARGDKAWD